MEQLVCVCACLKEVFPAFLLVLEESHTSNDSQDPNHQQNDHSNGDGSVSVSPNPWLIVLHMSYGRNKKQPVKL